MSDRTQDDPPDARPTDYFVVIPTGVLSLGPYATAVYGVLRDFADQRSHECWPSHRMIADRSGISVRKVREVLTTLREAGWVTWNQRTVGTGSLTSNVYRVHGSPTPLLHDMQQGRQDMQQGVLHDVQEVLHEVPRELRTHELEPKSQIPMVTADALTADPMFTEFWTAYPRKVGKAAALKAWRQATKRQSSSEIVAACRAMAADPNLPTDRRLIPHPTTWLNRDGWDDEPYPPNHDGKPPSGSRLFADTAALLAMSGLEIAQ